MSPNINAGFGAICEFSDLPEIACAHCQGTELEDNFDFDHEYEITATFPAQFPGRCIIDQRHKIKMGDLVSKVIHPDNPFRPIPGVICKTCTLEYPEASR